MQKVLIICTGNSCRSQMADGLISNFYQDIEVYSAGTKPEKVNPLAVEAMSQIGIDISSNVSNHVDEYEFINFDYVFTVCDNAKEICPVFPVKTNFIHFSFDDPADAKGTYEEKIVVYRKIRDQIQDYIKNKFIDIINNKI